MYGDLAGWWPLLSAPAAYAEEAGIYRRLLDGAGDRPPETVLELGSGGGNNASHLKRRFRCTLTDLSEEMLELSRTINPECEHLQGDMRTLRLGRTFDVVFVHDAVSIAAPKSRSVVRYATASWTKTTSNVRPSLSVRMSPLMCSHSGLIVLLSSSISSERSVSVQSNLCFRYEALFPPPAPSSSSVWARPSLAASST